MTKLFAITALLFTFSTNALALPINQLNRRIRLPATFTANYDFEGIVALSNCSGGLIQFEGMSDSSQAMILTNGHCLEGGFLQPNSFVVNKASSRSFTLLSPNATSVGRVTATQIMYGTLTKTDMAIYKLRETYAQIKSQFNIRPLTLSSTRPLLSENIEVISGYWKRGYSCGIEAFVFELHEGGYIWQDSLRFSRPGCETIGGTSGSPITRAGSKIVIGVNNTGNEDGARCTMNNPCEVDTNGAISFTQGFSYGEQTYWVYSCLTTTNEIDLSRPGCQLYH